MIICISGTPATGKTVVVKELKKILDCKVVHLSNLIDKIKIGYDKKRKVPIVDVKKLHFSNNGIMVIEGHISHLLKCDICIVLRSSPTILEKRMKKKRWSKSKINENIMAEILDTTTIEAIKKNKKVYEIDTTKKTPATTAKIIKSIIQGRVSDRYKAGRVDWIERYKKYLIKMMSG